MKKIIVAIVGGTLLLLGIALLVLPGPGLPIVAAGLAILGTEFFWARTAIKNAKATFSRLRRKSGLREWLRRRRKNRQVSVPK